MKRAVDPINPALQYDCSRKDATHLHKQIIQVSSTVITCLIFTNTDLRSHFWALLVDFWTTDGVSVSPVTYKI